MYPREEREWALFVLEECGGNLCAAERVTGISRESIRRWSEAGVERMRKPKKPKKPAYLTCAEKVALVEEVLAGGEAASVAAGAGVAAGTLSAWHGIARRERFPRLHPALNEIANRRTVLDLTGRLEIKRGL